MTPRELSRKAIEKIKENPSSWNQAKWHCNTSHCWAGHVDLLMGIPKREKTRSSLYHDVQKHMKMTLYQWRLMTYCGNSLADLEKWNNIFFEVGYDSEGFDLEGFDQNGFDRNGYDRFGFNSKGYDQNGYDFHGYDLHGYDSEGFDFHGYDSEGFDVHGYDSEGYDRIGRKRSEK